MPSLLSISLQSTGTFSDPLWLDSGSQVPTSNALFSQWVKAVPMAPWSSSSAPSNVEQLKCFRTSSWREIGKEVLARDIFTFCFTNISRILWREIKVVWLQIKCQTVVSIGTEANSSPPQHLQKCFLCTHHMNTLYFKHGFKQPNRNIPIHCVRWCIAKPNFLCPPVSLFHIYIHVYMWFWNCPTHAVIMR